MTFRPRSSHPSRVAGDYNQNGVVDAADYVVWRDSLGTSGTGLAADGNGDSVVNQLDYDFWRQHFGQTAGSGAARSAAIPEPSLLLHLASLALAERIVSTTIALAG